MILNIKAFIYRFSNIFGLRIYLAKKEEEEYVSRNVSKRGDSVSRSISIGMWHARNGFTTVYVYGKPFLRQIKAKIKHAFDFTKFE
jgi:hypothetical protein